MYYMTCIYHWMQKHMFGITFPDTHFVKSVDLNGSKNTILV
jgi:hypothetical protein